MRRRVRLSGTLESGVREREQEESEKEEKASREKWAKGEGERETASTSLSPSFPLGFMRFSRSWAAPEINRLRLPTAADRGDGVDGRR